MSGADWSSKLSELEERFRRARAEGARDDPEQYLSELLSDQSNASDFSELQDGQWLRVVALIRLILIDLEAATQQRPPADRTAVATEYLERYPLLKECLPVVQELFIREFQVRRRCGTIQSWAEFLALVPSDYRHRLRPAPRYWCQPWAVLGEGTFGEVFTAMDEELGREVAFKIQKEHHSQGRDERQRRDAERRKFQWEATVTSRLEHPSVVPMYGFEMTDDGRLGYAMRKLQWETLDDKIRKFRERKPQAPESRDEVADRPVLNRQKFSRINESFEDLLVPFAAACDAVGFAHKCGFLHNDIKPKHIAIGDKGETVVLDWGNARTLSNHSQSSERSEPPTRTTSQPDTVFAEEDARKETLLPSTIPHEVNVADPHETKGPDLTLPNASQNGDQAEDDWPLEYGTVLGTPAYISPEMWAGRGPEVGASSDIYSLGATLYELLTGQAPNIRSENNPHSSPPHQLDSRIPRPLSAICMQCLHDEPSERYGSAELVARDIRNWLADRTVDAYGESPWEQLVRWLRHRTTELLYSVMTIASIGLVVIGGWWFFVAHMRRNDVEDLAHDLRAHAAENAYEPIYALHRDLEFAAPLIRRQIGDTEREISSRNGQDPAATLTDRRWLHRLRLVLLKSDGSQTIHLADGDWIRSDLPEYLLTHRIVTDLDRAAPLENRELLIRSLWQKVDQDEITRLRAACLLATLSMLDEQWEQNDRSQLVVDSLLTATRRFDLLAIELLRPVHHLFLEQLKRTFRDPGTPNDQRRIAADALATYLAPQGDFLRDRANLDELIRLAVDATPQQFDSLIDHVKQYDRQAVEQLSQRLKDPACSTSQRAMAAASLLQIQRGEFDWTLFRFTVDPSLRTALIHLAADLDTDPAILLDQLEKEAELVDKSLGESKVDGPLSGSRESIRHGLILALGRFPSHTLPSGTVSVLRRCWTQDPDSGVHSAAEWALRKLGEKKWIADQKSQLEFTIQNDDQLDRSWWINSQGQTMIAVAADPLPCQMGADDEEKAYNSSIEPRFRATVSRPFAIASTETTVAQFEQFYDGYRQFMDDERTRDDIQSSNPDQRNEPISFVPFAHAAAYCNWLSQQENIPQYQWCYPVELVERFLQEKWPEKYNKFKETEFLFGDPGEPFVDLTKTGYRLPTEIEWEYACRFRTTSTWFFGANREFLSSYALHRDNADGPRLGPAGMWMPNRLGLFDVLGSAAEWCQDLRWTTRRLPDPSLSYSDRETSEPLELPSARLPTVQSPPNFDGLTGITSHDEYEEAAVRGGSFHDFGAVVRPSYRIGASVTRVDQSIGFRVVRTLPPTIGFPAVATSPPGAE